MAGLIRCSIRLVATKKVRLYIFYENGVKIPCSDAILIPLSVRGLV